MAGERNQDREDERLAEDDVLPEARVEAEVATFRNSLPPKPERQRPLPGSRLLRKGQKWTVYQSGKGHPAQPPTWRRGRRVGQARQNSLRPRRGRWVRGLPGDVGTDDEWDDEWVRGLPGDVGTDDEWYDEDEESSRFRP